MLLLYGASFTATSVLINRACADSTLDECFTFILLVGVCSGLLSLLLMFTVESPIMPQSRDCWLFLIGHSVTNSLAACLFFVSLSLITPMISSLVLSLEVALLAVLQYTMLSSLQPGYRNWEEILGLALVVMGNILGPMLGIVLDWRAKYTQTYETL